tara:strand:+ start:53 stop:646 length:594 start_codon:yes stop_codon:yes gene_type:complete
MKKFNKILVGTHNQGKFDEISFLLSKKIKKISPKHLGIGSPKETGKSFTSNARLKANYFSKLSNMVALSDDSGLEIKSLGNKPGIHSARWAKKYGGFNNAMKKILKLLSKKKNSKRKAQFICSLSIKFPKNKQITVVGKVKGNISERIRGKKGFGYDPIFIPQKKNLTFGEMNKIKKIKMDHRFIAFKKLKKRVKIL